jgi:hypothetical protein
MMQHFADYLDTLLKRIEMELYGLLEREYINKGMKWIYHPFHASLLFIKSIFA